MARPAIPVVATQYTVVIMQLLDAWMAGILGTPELAAIASSSLLVLLLVTFGTGFLSSVITTVSQSCGGNHNRDATRFAIHGIYAAAILGLPCVLIFPFSRQIFQFYGHEPGLAALEAAYFGVSLISIFPQLVSVSLSYYFIATHNTKPALVGSITGMVFNAIFSYTLIFGIPGFPGVGFIGAAWGTVVASFAQAALLFYLFTREERWRIYGTHVAKFSGATFRKLSQIGFPAAVHAAVDILSWGVILTFLIGKFGTLHLASATILVRFIHLAFLPADGFASTMMSAVGQSFGANDRQLARKQVAIAFKAIACYMFGVGVLLYLFKYPLITLFTSDSRVIAIGLKAIVFVCFFQFFDALNLTYINALYAAGDTLWPSLVNTVLCLTIFVGGGFWITHNMPELASYGVWLVATIYIFTQGLTFYFRWTSGAWARFLSSPDQSKR